LPFALDLMKSSLEAGHSLNRGLQVVVQEFADPLGGEFRTVLEQTRIGLPLPRALEDMLKRVPEEDLRLLVVAVKVQTEVGSSLALIVGRLAEIVRTRQRLRLQINALTAQSRLGGLIVGALPIVVLGMFSLINRDYANELFFDPTGIKILKIAAGLDVCAFITIRRLLRMDF
jgi:tight adherence protein B